MVQNWLVLKALFLCLILSGISSESLALTQTQTIYINKGQLKTSDSSFLPYYVFNGSDSFESTNQILHLNQGDTLVLSVINTDSETHGFAVQNTSIKELILKGDTATIELTFKESQTYIFYDYTADNKYSYLGLSSILSVHNNNSGAQDYYWNIKDHQKEFYHALEHGNSVDWDQYYPTYFTINGRYNPNINLDTVARVTGEVGDSILIHMVNTGRSIHSIHFHGYHSEIIHSSKHPQHKGRKKDTFSVEGGEVVTLLLVPDQTGEYPVHDHNLVAVTGGGIYPNGMFLTLLIK
jgi:FtsP/CotA-like multicopper oxidase with cupredoxin domain